MNKQREEAIEKLLKEMFLALRSMRPEHDHEEHEKEHKGADHRFGFGHHFHPHKFGRGHMDLLMRLKTEKEGISVKEIAESLHITPGAVTQMVDKAVEMGVVTREEDTNDRRSQRIKLSEKARDRIKKFRQGFVERLGPKFSNLTDSEISQLTALLGKINQSEEN